MAGLHHVCVLSARGILSKRSVSCWMVHIKHCAPEHMVEQQLLWTILYMYVHYIEQCTHTVHVHVHVCVVALLCLVSLMDHIHVEIHVCDP